MPRCSNTVVGILNIFVFLLSIPVLWMGIYLSVHGSTQCAKFLDKPMILLGVFLMVVSIAGIVGSWCKVQWLMWVYLVLMFILILLFFSYTIFAFVISGKGAGENIPGKAYKEYRLGSYSKWLQNHVKHNKDWKNFRSCLFDSKFCPQMEKDYGRDNVSAFNKRALGPLDSGCCKPSNDCNFTYITPTQWNKTSSGSQKNSDCQLWDNDSKKLCYDCKACKAGFVDSIKNTLKSVAVGNIFILLFLIALHVMGFYAARNNKEEKDFNQI